MHVFYWLDCEIVVLLGIPCLLLFVFLLQFLSHPALGDLLNDEDQKVWSLFQFSKIGWAYFGLFEFVYHCASMK